MPAPKKPRPTKQGSRKPAEVPPAPALEEPIPAVGFKEINQEPIALHPEDKAESESQPQQSTGSEAAPEAAAVAATAPDAISQITRLKADLVITRHSAVAVGAGFIPVPLVDFAAVTGVQLTMLAQICAIYQQPFSKEAAASIIASLVGGAITGGEAGSLAIGSRLKFIPVVGTAVSWLLTPALAGATTYAIGKVFVRHLESGGTLLTFDGRKLKGYMEKAMEEGKKRMPHWGKPTSGPASSEPAPAV